MPTLSLCMIVKDEEERLPRALASLCDNPDLKGLLAEVIIVDTGSKDRTMEIGRDFGARIIETPWEDNFSRARNVAVEAATSDWILFIDADDIFIVKSIDEFKRALEDKSVVAYRVPVDNRLGGGAVEHTHYTRLFRNHLGLKYRGRVHEQVTEAVFDLIKRSPEYRGGELDCVLIDHDGYVGDLAGGGWSERDERNLRLLRLASREEPGNAYLRYKLAQILESRIGQGAGGAGLGDERSAKEVEEFRASLFEAAEMVLALSDEERRVLAYGAEILTKASLEYTGAAMGEEALGTAREAARLLPHHPPVLLALGLALLEFGGEGGPAEAREIFNRAAKCHSGGDGGEDRSFYYDRGHLSSTLAVLLAATYRKEGSGDKALGIIEEGLKKVPDDEPLRVAMLETLLEAGRAMDVLKVGIGWLKGSANPNPVYLLKCADAAEALGDKERAVQWRREAKGLKGA